MEFLVGRTVKKEFLGLGIIKGIINCFDPISGFFDIVYEDGDSEELDLKEVVDVLEGEVEVEKIELGRFKGCRPKKRRRRGDAICDVGAGKFSDFLLINDDDRPPKVSGNLETLGEIKCGNTSTNGIVVGFDLNVDISMEEEEEEEEEKPLKVKHCFDINLGLEEEDIDEIQVVEGGFKGIDLNVIEESQLMVISSGLTGVEQTDLIDSNGLSKHVEGGVCLKEDNSAIAVEETQLRATSGLSEDVRGDTCLGTDAGVQSDSRVVASKDTSPYFHLKTFGSQLVIAENDEEKSCLRPTDKEVGSRKKRGRPSKKSKLVKMTDEGIQSEDRDLGEGCGGVTSSNTSANLHLGDVGIAVVNADNHVDKACSEPPDKKTYSHKKRGRPSKKLKSTTQTMLSTTEIGSSDMIFSENHEDKTCMKTPDKEAFTPRKRARPSSTSQTVLRRSTRRSSSTSLIHVSNMDESLASNAASLSHEISELDSNFEAFKVSIDLPPKLELPPSSKTLNVDEISIIDLFSVYACLRSFSTVLFLSPFRLEDFLEALNNRCPNSLINSIHFSVLHTLKLHMEFLSEEGSQSATNCLRSLNWELLDVVTWPIYMVEYLLIQGSALKPTIELSHLKVMDDYYIQSPALKIKILQFLCDDVIEAESLRSELNRRTQASEFDMDTDRIANVEIKRKRKDQMDDGGGSCLTQDVVDDTADWNSDECCLCKMDGNLICCDGCPAAYHTRCVGITKDTLPDGEWFCPECVINKYDTQMKSRRSLRGAELLGTDPHGRLYFGTCGYLLVLDSCEPESSYNFYDTNDLNIVIEVLKSSDILYGSIINAISMHWGILGAKGYQNSQMDTTRKVLDLNSQISAMTSSVAEPLSDMTEVKFADKPYETYVRNEDFDLHGYKVPESVVKYDSETIIKFDLESFSKTGSSVAKSEALAEISKVAEVSQTSQEISKGCLNGTSGSEIPGETHFTVAEGSLQSTLSCVRLEKNKEASLSPYVSVETNPGKGLLPRVHSEPVYYVNSYTFGQTAACVLQELIRNSPDNVKEDSNRSSEEIISAQMRAISKKSANFCWSNIQDQDAQQEDCGWCFSCQSPAESETCLFNMTTKKPAPDASKSGAVSLHCKKSSKSHLFAVICQILSIEERLTGLLSGPWKNASYSRNWRKNVLKAPDVVSVKPLLLTLELNLRRLALLPEWLKHVDSVVTMGSASHVMTTSVQVPSSKHASGGRKRAKFTVPEPNSLSTAAAAAAAAAKSSTFWWRGGSLSRQLFNYNVLPHSLASKGGRQAGCKKILGMLYHEGSEFAKQSKYIAWRAAVEMSTNVAHLAYQVRELDSNIRWDDFESIHFSHLSKESKKSMKLFKKVTIRRKCTEGTNIKYLLDFGKRKGIPDTVTRNGIMLEISSSERKKYWLEESLIPLHILKAYEEKKLARTSSKVKPGSHDVGGKILKSSRKSGLLHLLSKGQKSEYYKCGHCNKDVLIRDAVTCQNCEGFFHKRHARQSEYSSAAECTYQCQRCGDKIPVKKSVKRERKKWKVICEQIPVKKSVRRERKKRKVICEQIPVKKSVRREPKKRKVKPQKSKIASTIGRRESLPRKVKHVPVQIKKGVAAKKRKRVKSRNQQSKKSKKEICWYKGKRTHVFYAKWCNGLRLTRNLNDECAVQFRGSKLLLPSQHLSANIVLPKCHLCCEASYMSTVIYVNCENCKEWFHGEAFGVTAENSCMILGFRCHKCLKRNPPLCPYLQPAPGNEVGLHEGGIDAGSECPTDVSVIAGKNCREQRISSKEDANGSLYSHESVHADQNTNIISDSISKEEKIGATPNHLS